ncbi:MAG: hypothetical protein QOD13_1285 [Thermoleophilaceae bacterium]|jgi:uncharacterized protein YbcI|nr:hypothetical protein [Thermoleophilaceae bacterium]
MPGFEFRYRLDGGQATVRSFVFKNTETLSRGDLVNFEESQVDLGACGDTALLGCALETLDGEGGKTYVRVITDADAVYAVEDPNARTAGDHLDLTSSTNGQGVATSAGSEFTVVLDSPADEETLVRINVESHHQVGPKDGLGRQVGGDLNAAVARAVVRFHREETGRGPNKARAFYRDDIIVVVLEDLMTQAERSLVARGEYEAVMNMRAAFQRSIRTDLVGVIEQMTGASVRAFMSSNNLDPDIAVEVFVLDQPIGEGRPPGA